MPDIKSCIYPTLKKLAIAYNHKTTIVQKVASEKTMHLVSIKLKSNTRLRMKRLANAYQASSRSEIIPPGFCKIINIKIIA